MTADYYRLNAQRFVDETRDLDLGELHRTFLDGLQRDSLILDAGCGSGRDARVFRDAGHRVVAFDASPELVELASLHLGEPVQHRHFSDVIEHAVYDGIWACASLLHVPEAELLGTLAGLWRALKPGGLFYLNFKEGEGERLDPMGRHFTDANEARARRWLAPLAGVADICCWTTPDRRPHRPEPWLNLLVRKGQQPRNKLIAGGPDPLLPHLSAALSRAAEIDIAVAFVKATGLRVLLPDLDLALRQQAAGQGGARIRILTSDYLDITDPEALEVLELLQQQGAQVRIFLAAQRSFHLKTYIFLHTPSANGTAGTAFVGSSNLSRQALQEGLEWNYRIDYPQDDGFLEARARFDELFQHPDTIALTPAWIADYAKRRKPPALPVSPGSQERDPPPTPTAIQVAALRALAQARSDGHVRGLVVMATGLGKTWLAAFDAAQAGARRILFLAHRDEILTHAAATFLRMRPGARIGFYKGDQRDRGADILCASVQTLAKRAHLDTLDPEAHDYIVVDEFHHAAAHTYRRILRHVRPRFLLGLTATPDRTDQADILSLCDDNLVFRCDLFDAITQAQLVPFRYWGIVDDTVDYAAIPWRNGRFDPEALESQLATQARNEHAFRTWQQHRQSRTLAFCASIRHAEHVHCHFEAAGIRSAAVYGGSTVGRTEALDRLAGGQLDILFSVDLFSEGVDVPAIDTVLMLRPTESKILFLQQLGRGLRKLGSKDHLVVLDFVANHQGFLHKPAALLNCPLTHADLARAARDLEQGVLPLPPGCQIHLDLQFLEFLKHLRRHDGEAAYRELRELLGRRPTATEFHLAGESLPRIRAQHGHWFAFVAGAGGDDAPSIELVERYGGFLRAVEMTNMSRSFKMITLDAFQRLDGWRVAPTLAALAERSWNVLAERGQRLNELPVELRGLGAATSAAWQQYWRGNPIAAWLGESATQAKDRYFRLEAGRFQPQIQVRIEDIEPLTDLVQELIDWRLASYAERPSAMSPGGAVADVVPGSRQTIPRYAHLAEAEARTPTQRVVELSRQSGTPPGELLVAPILDSQGHSGETQALYCRIQPGDTVPTDAQLWERAESGHYVLTDAPRAQREGFCRLRGLSPLELAIGQPVMREEIPALFGEHFNPGSWNVGHVVLNSKKAHVLLVTLNKQGKASEHRYHDCWIDPLTLQWQTQNATTPQSSRGKALIHHAEQGIALHLFVRDRKLGPDGLAAPFIYQGRMRYLSHNGSAPMTVQLQCID